MIWPVNAPCLASFLMIVLTVYATSFKPELTTDELVNHELIEWRLERNRNRMLESNSTEHGKKSVNAGLVEYNENKSTTEPPLPPFRTIFEVLHKPKTCPKGQRVDLLGNCKEEINPSSK